MSHSQDKLKEFTSLLKKIVADTPNDVMVETGISGFFTFKGTHCPDPYKAVYEPGIIIMGQGRKVANLGGQKFELSVGRFVPIFLPVAWEVEVVEASEENPLIMSGFKMDLSRIANILMRMDRVAPLKTMTDSSIPSSVYSEPLTDDMLDPLIRLLRMAEDPLEREVLAESTFDELYFRLICNDKTGSLQQLLHHRGQIPQISRVVNHLHQNLEEVVSVNELADLVNMSPSGFRKAFREVMHMPPLQYAKSIKLDKAQIFIRQGLNASEAGYKVGYNSPAQFSREYKRHFGYTPSETLALGVS